MSTTDQAFTMQGTVSVVIPVYNAEPYVEAAVRSALQQPEVLEVVLVDDAGPDNSLAVCQRLAATEPRVRLFRHPDHANHGAAASRNLGCAHARGTYIAFLDADDAFLPDRFAAERRIFAEHPDAEGVYGALGVLFHSEEARQHYANVGLAPLTTVSWAVPPEQLFRALVETGKGFGYFSIVALTVKRTTLERLGQVFPDNVVLHEDTDLIFRLAYHARLYAGIIDAPVALRGVHAANRITNNAREHYTRFTLYRSLDRWATKVKVPEELHRRIQVRLAYHTVMGAPAGLGQLRFLGRFLRNPGVLDFMDLRKAWCDRMLGTDTKASALLQKVIWRMVHKPQP